MNVSDFIDVHFRHFNAQAVRSAAIAYRRHLDEDGVMLLTIAGAMSTAEAGRYLAEMIAKDKVHAICCTGANLEEDVFNLIGHELYKQIPGYRDLTPQQEAELAAQGFNRVTDTCIPEDEVMRHIDALFTEEIRSADTRGQRLFPHEVFYRLLRSGVLDDKYQIDPGHSWLVAAAEKNLPMFVPGWEDSTLGNTYAARLIDGGLAGVARLKDGIDYMLELSQWYQSTSREHSIGFFQIGGGIAGDFPICVVPMIARDLHREVPLWGYFCQICDSTTSYGSYSGAVPNEKITWGKLGVDTPKFVIESDATIVMPLICAYVLGW